MLQRFRGGREPDPPRPERVSSDLTGSYSSSGGDDRRVTLQLNQAGHHLEGWWQSHRWRSPNAPAELAYWRLQADLESDQGGRVTFRYRRFEESAPRHASSGTIVAERTRRGPRISLRDSEIGELGLIRRSAAARLADDTVERMPETDLVRAAETSPFDFEAEPLYAEALDELHQGVEAYLARDHGPLRAAEASRINGRARSAFGLFAVQQVPMVTARLARDLTLRTVRGHGGERSLWVWLAQIVDEHPSGDMTGDIQDFTGLQPGETGPHAYRWKFLGWGGQVYAIGGGQMWVGELSIQKPRPGRPDDPEWNRNFFCTMAGAGAGVGVSGGEQDAGWIEFETTHPWGPDDFLGRIQILTATVSAATPASRRAAAKRYGRCAHCIAARSARARAAFASTATRAPSGPGSATRS